MVPVFMQVACSSCPQVYILMGEHLRELCRTLQLSDELRLKIWTCFEHSLVHCTDLMVDRHLDQLLLCSIYIIVKVSKLDFTFLTLYKIIVLLLQDSNVEIPFKNIISCYSSCLAADMNASLNQFSFSLLILHSFTWFMTKVGTWECCLSSGLWKCADFRRRWRKPK